ncbi:MULTISPECIES: alpha/beta fold hydrolase [unclassified Streptomyces]|uniref:thioesterase II family protein n=1 Tax=unclassified Streptomyces TaxID=2593676 RepID=UPI0020340C94|nr:alpha/beta fold hydrolase [Streptomyces sp. RKAG290]MCM2414184.1 alpha/beta fold hydrolase [Streptomyces sp. RKAG290]
MRRTGGAGTGPVTPWLFCFHHAGAGISAFARWQQVLGDAAEVVPVLLPGRGPRAKENRITDVPVLMNELRELITPLLDRPYLLYGHSLGGLVAHALTRTLEDDGLLPPVRLVIGAVPPPHLRNPLLRGAGLPDAELLDLLVEFEAAPPEAAGRDSSLWRRHVIPALRDDLRLGEALCQVNADAAVGTPLLALAGREDRLAPLTEMAEWADYSVSRFRLQTLAGGHYFVRERVVPELLREVALELRETVQQEYRAESSARQEGGTRLLPTPDLSER